MRTDIEILSNIIAGSNNILLNSVSLESASIIKNKISEIPGKFFEPRISIDGTPENRISLLEFSLKTANMNQERKNGLMRRYNIDPYDIEKLQGIVDSIKVASEYGSVENKFQDKENNSNNGGIMSYGIALSDEKQLDKAYPLWLAYLYADSKNPYEDIRRRLIQDGTDDKYSPEYVVGLIEHTNLLMAGKSESEKKDFYMHSISDILDDNDERPVSRQNSGRVRKQEDFER